MSEIYSKRMTQLWRSAEHAVAADRFARKIVRFLKALLARSRQLNGNPLGGINGSHASLQAHRSLVPSSALSHDRNDPSRINAHRFAMIDLQQYRQLMEQG